MESKMIHQEDVARSYEIERDGVKYFANEAGIISERPVTYYQDSIRKVFVTLNAMCPELSIYLNNLRPVFTYDFDTFATGYGYIFMNPLFFDKLMDKGEELSDEKHAYLTVMAVYLHEIYHNIFDHMNDGKKSEALFPDGYLQNCAMDYSINPLIEKFYGLDGIFNAISGLYREEFLGKTWKEIYPQLTKPETPWSELRQEVRDVYKKIDNNKQQQGGGMSMPPQPPKDYTFSEDFKAGYESQYKIIRGVIENCSRQKLSISETIEALKDEATRLGITLRYVNEAVNVNSEKYNEGVSAAWTESIVKLEEMLKGIQSRDGESSKDVRGNDDHRENLKNAIDDLFKKQNRGGGEKQKDTTNNNNNSQNGEKDNDSNGNNSGGDGNDGNDENGNDENNTGNNGKNGNNKPIDDLGDNTIGGDESSKGDESQKRSEVDNKMKKIMRERKLDDKTLETDEKTRERIMKENLENLAKKTKNDETKKMLKKYIEEVGKKLGMDDHESTIRWQDILKRYFGRLGVKFEKQFVDRSTRDYYGSGIIRKYNTTVRSREIGHIVIALDNSGSVLTSGDVPGFLREVYIALNSMHDDCVVDFIQFTDRITKCTRLIHKKGQTDAEIERVSHVSGGGTAYHDVMYQMSLLMSNDLNNSEIVDEFRGKTVTVDKKTRRIAPASCCIIFTDGDFARGNKYLGIDTSKLLVFCINVKNIDDLGLSGTYSKFIPCVRLIETFENGWETRK